MELDKNRRMLGENKIAKIKKIPPNAAIVRMLSPEIR